MGLADRDYMRQRGKKRPVHTARFYGKTIGQSAIFSFLKRVFIFIGIIVVLTWVVDQAIKAPYSSWKSIFPSKAPAIALPETGNTTLYQLGLHSPAIAQFEVVSHPSHSENHHLVKLVDTASGRPVLSVFVRSGEIATMKVPLGTYKVNIAQGKDWQGETNLFGRNMLVKQGLTPLKFYAKQNSITGHILKLEDTVSGNYPTRPLSSDQF